MTIKKLTMQEVFDTAVIGLLKQGVKSAEPGNPSACRYRGEGGLKCAVGFLIPDELYDDSIECCEVSNNAVLELLDKCGVPTTTAGTTKLLEQLQEIHDYRPVGKWRGCFNDLAGDFGLDVNF